MTSRISALALTLAVMGACASSVAHAANQFTIDTKPDSFGAVVTDRAGNGYLAWEHAGGPGADVPLFCRLPPDATRCQYSARLSLPGAGAGSEANANQLFPILGPGNVVWVVTSRYVLSDTLIWTSTNGGRTFGAPHVIPYVPVCESPPPPGQQCLSYSYADGTDIDDAVPVTPGYATYDRQTYLTSSGQPSVYWLESSNDPFLGFNIDDTAEVVGGPENATEFTFEGTGGGGVAGSALGTTSNGEVVEAYWLEQTPPKLAYYVFKAHNPDPISPQIGWSGPKFLADGYLPRLADGAAGLFMLSADSVGSAAQPTGVDVRKYNAATHSFGSPRRLGMTSASVSSLFRGGGLAENYDTGELAAVWPQYRNPGGHLMQLYLSTDGGARFSPGESVATVADGYADADNARVAIADSGTGFVTFWDDRGLEVADLDPVAAEYRELHARVGVVPVSFTCPAPRGRCAVKLTLSRHRFGRLTGASFTVPAGATRALKLRLSATTITTLASHRYRMTSELRLRVHSPNASPQTIGARPTLT
jgi:hypothetical protein